MKGLIRKRSTTSARLQRAFSAKGLRASDSQQNMDIGSNDDIEENKDKKLRRQFIMETSVQFTTGVQSQERHLFLFSDLLLVAKSRNGGNFKLKEKVRVSEMWLANCLDDVSEVSKTSDTSFVIGWPTTNVVATFNYVATKDLWYNKLSQLISEERDKEASSINIQITYNDALNSADIHKTVNISCATTVRECIGLVMPHLEKSPGIKFQLWVKIPTEETPYPLIGHEFPFAICMNYLRNVLQQECEPHQFYNTDYIGQCEFILRQERQSLLRNDFPYSPERVKKISKKARKSPIRIHRVFKRSNSKNDVTDGTTHSKGTLFGLPLNKICSDDGTPPKSIMILLHHLLQKGPFTVGIFRKSANARLVRELKDKLDNGEDMIDAKNTPITAIAALFKDFLRSLPDCLLCSDLYEQWLEMPNLVTSKEKMSKILMLCSRLPRNNLNLLQYFLCVLYHIARRSSENMMSASNLAVCVGPSILWPSSPFLALSQEASKQTPAVVEFLIERCCTIFGKGILSLMGDPPATDPFKQDSGAEESDSLHSGNSLHSCNGLKRDDSSIDSLERELICDGELSPFSRKVKMSLTNLSRDSGLTMSDSQLYTPDEEETESISSNHSNGEKNYAQQNDKFQHYTAPNNPNAIYTAVYKRPDKVQISYDEPDSSYYATPNREQSKSPYYNYNNYDQSSPKNLQSCGTPNIKYRSNHLEEEDAIYSMPTGDNSHQISPMVSNFQRHDWMRRCSNLKKVVSKSCNNEESLMRSNSEESLLNKYNDIDYGVSLGAAGNSGRLETRDTECFTKRTQQIEQNYIEGRESPLRRTQSDHQIINDKTNNIFSVVPTMESTPIVKPIQKDGISSSKWLRSRSTPQIHEEGDGSYDSSTLSDDDSTPHVSRSNSRSKECRNSSLYAWDNSSNSRNSSFKSEKTIFTVVSAENSTPPLSSNPPCYEEALNRRSLINCSGTPPGIPEYAIREEKMKSARAKQLYEESLRIYQEENTYPCYLVRASPAQARDDTSEVPPPLPPKFEAPPLPPKQKTCGRLSEGRLKHLPPVHIETINRKSFSGGSSTNQTIYESPLHKTIIYTNDNPPILPPKGRTLIEVEATNCVLPVEKKSIETQTDDCDLLDDDGLYEEGTQTDDSWSDKINVTSVTVPDKSYRKQSGHTKRRNSSRRSRTRSLPDNETLEYSDDDEEDWESSRGDYYTSTYGGLKDIRHLDPDLQEEITWSVSQLRSIFGDSLKGAKVHLSSPYRSRNSSRRMPMNFYHLGTREAFTYRPPNRPQNNYEEESYV